MSRVLLRIADQEEQAILLRKGDDLDGIVSHLANKGWVFIADMQGTYLLCNASDLRTATLRTEKVNAQ